MMGVAGALEHWLLDGTERQTDSLISCHVEGLPTADERTTHKKKPQTAKTSHPLLLITTAHLLKISLPA